MTRLEHFNEFNDEIHRCIGTSTKNMKTLYDRLMLYMDIFENSKAKRMLCMFVFCTTMDRVYENRVYKHVRFVAHPLIHSDYFYNNFVSSNNIDRSIDISNNNFIRGLLVLSDYIGTSFGNF